MLHIDKNTIIISDPHFGHTSINTFMPMREIFAKENKFRSFEEYMITEWNKHLEEGKQVFCLGDFSFKTHVNYGNFISGNNILLPGNHDHFSEDTYLSNGFKNVLLGLNLIENNIHFKSPDFDSRLLNCLIVSIEGVKIMFSHFPVFDDNPYDKKFHEITDKLNELFLDFDCNLNIHGHTHSLNAKEKFCFNASIEANNFKLLSIGEILEKATLRN